MTTGGLTVESTAARKGRPPRVPHERMRYLRVYFAESEYERVRIAATLNQHKSMSEFGRLAISNAAEESGAGPIVIDAEQPRTERRRRNGYDQPIELERRRKKGFM